MSERRATIQVLDHDAVWPRTHQFRYRIYGRVGGELTVLAACEEPGGIGVALVTMQEDQKSIGRRLADLGQIGVLDVLPDVPNPRGEWIVLPWGRS